MAQRHFASGWSAHVEVWGNAGQILVDLDDTSLAGVLIRPPPFVVDGTVLDAALVRTPWSALADPRDPRGAQLDPELALPARVVLRVSLHPAGVSAVLTRGVRFTAELCGAEELDERDDSGALGIVVGTLLREPA